MWWLVCWWVLGWGVVVGGVVVVVVGVVVVVVELLGVRRDALGWFVWVAGFVFTMRGGALYFLAISRSADEGVFIQALLEERVLAVPGRGFGCPGYVRFAFCVDTKVIEGARQGVKNAVAKLG